MVATELVSPEDRNSDPLASLPQTVKHAIQEAAGEFFEQVKSKEEELLKAEIANRTVQVSTDDLNKGGVADPKATFADPFSMMDSVGLGYRGNPSRVTYETLRQMSEQSTLLGAIFINRINQVMNFCRKQENKYSIGYAIRPRGGAKHRGLYDWEHERIAQLQAFTENMGLDENIQRDGMRAFFHKSVRDRLTYDQVGWEKTRTVGGRIHAVYVLPGDTLRVAQPITHKDTPWDIRELKKSISHVQVVNGRKTAEFTPNELAFLIANPRTAIRVNSYGYPETEMLVTTVTSHLWAEEWNKRLFAQGSTTRGVFNLKGNINPRVFESFRRQWYAQVSGVHNAWKTPILNTDGLEYIPLQMSNTEMGYQMWMEYLIKIGCAIFLTDPAEINFDLRGGVGQQPIFMSTNEAQQKQSKDRGLRPLLHYLEDNYNRHVLYQIDPRFEFAFVGLDAKTEEQAIELRTKEASTYRTLNEVRDLEGLAKVKDGDIVLNPTFTGYINQKAMMDAQSQQMGGGGGPPGGDDADASGGDEEPYAGRFGKDQGDEEEDAAQKLHAHDKGNTRSSTPTTPEAARVNDWVATVHSALPKPDLRKSEDAEVEAEVYDTIDL